ncbi:MAG: P27 family phage terminase small subunit [Dehalococcoidia bacterium]
MFPPKWLPAKAKLHFKRLIPKAIEQGSLNLLNLPLFEVLCICRAAAWEVRDIIEAEGKAIEDTTGEKPHPLLRLYSQWQQQLEFLEKEFRIEPGKPDESL